MNTNPEINDSIHIPENNGSSESYANNAKSIFTKWMTIRSLIFILFTVVSWWISSNYSPEKQPFNGLSVWDVAYLVCGVSGMVSLWMGEWGAVHKKYMSQWLLGMMLRGGAPIAILLLGRITQMDWESRGIFVSFGVAYLLTLFAETLLSVYLLVERYKKYCS